MKKFLAIILALAMVLALAACGETASTTETVAETTTEPASETTAPAETETPAETEEPVANAVEPGTSWNSVADFNYDAPQEGVWQYYFSGDNGETYDPCTSYADYDGYGGWHPWEGSYIGVGYNNDMPDFNELNTDCYSENWSGQMGVLAFCAPAAGKYVVTACVQNPWEQDADLFTFKKADGTVVLTQDISEFVAVAGYVTPTDVELAEGEMLYIFCDSTTSNWMSAYINCTIYYEPTDDSVYEVPEVEIPVTYTFINSAEAEYSAVAEFNQEGSVWVYASTTDGVNFTEATDYEEPDWDGDGNPDAAQIYSENGTGVGFNYSVENYLEANVTDVGGEAMAIGFKAPADGTYTVAGYAFNAWGQDCAGVYAVLNGEVVAECTLGNPDEFSATVDMKAGDIVYVYAQSNGGWVSAYLDVYAGETVTLTGEWVADGEVEELEMPYEAPEASYSALDEFNGETADGTWVYAITTDGVNFTLQNEYIEREWDDDPDPDACEWYMSEDDYTGIGVNADAYGYLEANVSDSFANGGSAAALGFKAPAAGEYIFTVFTQNLYGQNGNGVNAVLNGEVVAVCAFDEEVTETEITVTMAEGDVLYFYGDAAEGWVSAYLSVYVA